MQDLWASRRQEFFGEDTCGFQLGLRSIRRDRIEVHLRLGPSLVKVRFRRRSHQAEMRASLPLQQCRKLAQANLGGNDDVRVKFLDEPEEFFPALSVKPGRACGI